MKFEDFVKFVMEKHNVKLPVEDVLAVVKNEFRKLKTENGISAIDSATMEAIIIEAPCLINDVVYDDTYELYKELGMF